VFGRGGGGGVRKRIQEGLGVTAVFALGLIAIDYFNGREIDIAEVAISAAFILIPWVLIVTIIDFYFRETK
jgi:hypothetical protein